MPQRPQNGALVAQAGNLRVVTVSAGNTSVVLPLVNALDGWRVGALATPHWNTTAWVSAASPASITLSFGTAPVADSLVTVAIVATLD